MSDACGHGVQVEIPDFTFEDLPCSVQCSNLLTTISNESVACLESFSLSAKTIEQRLSEYGDTCTTVIAGMPNGLVLQNPLEYSTDPFGPCRLRGTLSGNEPFINRGGSIEKAKSYEYGILISKRSQNGVVLNVTADVVMTVFPPLRIEFRFNDSTTATSPDFEVDVGSELAVELDVTGGKPPYTLSESASAEIGNNLQFQV